MSRILFVVSARLPAPSSAEPAQGLRGAGRRARTRTSSTTPPSTTRSSRAVSGASLGIPVAQAWLAFTMRRDYAAIVTDGEHIGIPLAALLKLPGSRAPHVTIGHRLAARKKRPFFRWLKLHSHITRIALHAQRQLELGRDELRNPRQNSSRWCPIRSTPTSGSRRPSSPRSADLQRRARVPRLSRRCSRRSRVWTCAWSSAPPATGRGDATPPRVERFTNVEVASFDYFALRDLYARAAMVVVPLADVDFQAGVTTILEAMSMGKPVIVTHSLGQTDVVEDRRRITRGQTRRGRAPAASPSCSSAELDGPVEPTGFYVPPSDPQALRRAIVYLLSTPKSAPASAPPRGARFSGCTPSSSSASACAASSRTRSPPSRARRAFSRMPPRRRCAMTRSAE